MNAAFDTHQVFKTLQASGLSESEAEAITDALRQSREFDLGQLASKSDLAEVKADIAAVKADLVELRAATRADIAEVRTTISDLRSEMLKYMIGQTFVILGVVAALLRWIH